MTVAELTEVLKELPQDLEVVTTQSEEGVREVYGAQPLNVMRVRHNVQLIYGDYVRAASEVGETHGTSAPFKVVLIR